MKHRKKIIIALVEGHSDFEVLRPIISSLFDDCYNGLFTVEFIEEREDVTARKGISPMCIEQWISMEYIVPFLKKNFLEEEDIQHIIQFTDLDGSYIDDKHIEEKKITDIIYSENSIVTKSKKDISKRNSNKRKNLDYLFRLKEFKLSLRDSSIKDTPSIKNVPYGLFYFSSNLDHFLYGEANLNSSKKISKAIEFARTTSVCEFEQMLLNGGLFFDYIAKNQTYFESWEFIAKDTNSLSRYSNINILIDAIENGEFI